MKVNRRWTPYAAGFLVCLLFVALGLPVIQYPGAQYGEALFVSFATGGIRWHCGQSYWGQAG